MADVVDKIITLGGQTFPVLGISRGAARSEFEGGIKVGPATYDNREDAFFLVLNDFTGGFGSKHLNIREELGTYWFADPANAPETSYAGRVTLPLAQTQVIITDEPTAYNRDVNIGTPYIEWDDWYVFGLGSAIYTLGVLGAQPVRRYNDTAHLISIIGAADATEGTSRLYASFHEGGLEATPMMSLTDGETWQVTEASFVTHDLAPLISGITGDLISQDTVYNYQTSVQFEYQGGDVIDPNNYLLVPQFTARVYAAISPNFRAPPGVTTEVTRVAIEDLFFWDHKVLGVWDDTKISFMVPASGAGLVAAIIPKGSYITAVSYLEIGSFESGSTRIPHTGDTGANPYENVPAYTITHGYVATGHTTYTTDQVVSLVKGQEPWNHLIENDEQVVAALDIARELRFIGVVPASWGQPSVTVRGGAKLYQLDFTARSIYPIEVGSNKPLISGRLWQGAVVLTDGWSVFEYNPAGQTSRNIGFPRKWGIPPNLVGTDTYQIVDILPLDDELIALAVDTVGNSSILMRWNGVGWHQIGKRMDDFFAQYCFRATFPLPGEAIFDDRSQAIIVPGVNAAGTEYSYWQFNLPAISHQPTVGIDTFGDSGPVLYTGWIDGGFFDIDGTLLRMNADAFYHHATDHQVKIEYRLDNDPDSELTATWTQMVDSDGTASVFTSTRDALYFNSTAPKAGRRFRTVQFKITLIRGSDATLSPELRALTLVYLKTPELRTSWTFRIDLNRMLEMKEEDNVFYIDDAPATLETVWETLRDLWTNSHVLVPLTVPNVISGTLYVKLTSIPLSFDDFKLSATSRGTIDIEVLEPVT